jgi:uncharacterized protein (TIGR03067 family)
MHWRIPALLVTAVILAGFSYLATTSDAKEKGGKDKKALQGTWKGSAGDKKAQLTIEGDKFTFMFGDSTASGTFKIDPSKKPKQIDMTVTKGSDEHTKKYEGKTSKGLYELDGDKLKWLANEPGKDDRPEAFPKKGEETKNLYIVFEREKK